MKTARCPWPKCGDHVENSAPFCSFHLGMLSVSTVRKVDLSDSEYEPPDRATVEFIWRQEGAR